MRRRQQLSARSLRAGLVAGVCSLLTTASALEAQRPPDAAAETRAARTAIDRLAVLEGEWEGEVSVARGPGARLTVRQVERIRRVAAGTALLIQGTGRLPDAPPDAPPTFDAAAIVTWDAATGRYLMLAAGGSGRALSLEPAVRDDGLTWSFDAPGGARVRYVITIEGGTRWRETGETSFNGGESWTTFLTMDLRKRTDADEPASPRR